MLDWLRIDPRTVPAVTVGGQALPIAVRRRGNARRMTLRLAPDGSEARISIPTWIATAEAIAFVRSRTDWLERQLAVVPKAMPVSPGGTLSYRGETLAIRHDSAAPRRCQPVAGAIVCGGPADTLVTRLTRWLEGEALRLLTDDLAHYCARAGVPVPALSLSRAQRRWGSCARSGAIRINWRLVMAPDAVRRSVVAHEVAHILHFDHSPRFHRALADLYDGDIAEANAWLKRNGRTLYASFG